MSRRESGQDGVAAVVGALLVLAALVGFTVVYATQWAPVFHENREGERSAALQTALGDWGATAETYIGNGYANRSFSRVVPLGATTTTLTSSQRSTGTIGVDPAPSMAVHLDGVQLASVSGTLRVDAAFQRYPAQTHRYAFGALELTQDGSSWVDLRSVLTATRSTGGLVGLNLQAVGIEGAQTGGGGSDIEAVGTIENATARTGGAGTVRALVQGVPAGAWRAAVNRTLNGGGLLGETAANCAASAQAFCFQVGTNTATSMDVYVRNVAPGWSLVSGRVRVELRS